MAQVSFASRIWLAFISPLKLLFDGEFATAVSQIGDGVSPRLTEPEPEPKPVIEETEPEAETTSALQLLAIFQREGRFIDFLQEDVTEFSDADIGAAARVVHEGCARGIRDYIELTAVRTESEGDAVELADGFDASRIRVTGNVVGEPPFKGKLAHHGWQVTQIKLPTLAQDHDPSIVAPAEVEL